MNNPSSSTYISTTSSIQTENDIKVKSVESPLQKITIATLAFQIALIFYCIAHCILLSELSYYDSFSTIARVLQYCTLGFLLIKILLFSRYTAFEIVIYLVFFVIAALGAYNYNGNTELIYLVLFIVGARDVNVRTICKTALPVIAACGILILLLSLAGIIGNRSAYQVNYLTDEIVYRQAFGFTHYNTWGRISLAAFACYLYLRYKKFNMLDICLILVWSALLYFVISSKTAPILMVVSIILVLLSKIMSLRSLTVICAILGAIGIIGSLILSYFYDPYNGFMGQINTWLANRIQSAHYFFENFPITLFGQSINFSVDSSSSSLVLDNAYVSLLFRYGVVNLLAIIAAYIVAFIKAYRENLPVVLIILTMMLLVGIAEYWIYILPGMIVLSIAFGKHPNAKIEQRPILKE